MGGETPSMVGLIHHNGQDSRSEEKCNVTGTLKEHFICHGDIKNKSGEAETIDHQALSFSAMEDGGYAKPRPDLNGA